MITDKIKEMTMCSFEMQISRVVLHKRSNFEPKF